MEDKEEISENEEEPPIEITPRMKMIGFHLSTLLIMALMIILVYLVWSRIDMLQTDPQILYEQIKGCIPNSTLCIPL